MPTLTSERLILRSFQTADLDRLAELMANPDFMKFSLGTRTRAETEELLEKLMNWDAEGRPSQFAVRLQEDSPIIGLCGFLHQDVDGEQLVEISYRFHPDYWGKGIATEAARSVRDHGFRDLGLNHVISLIHPDNAASRGVAQKNGMIVEKETVFKGLPSLVFGITRERWRKLCAGQ